MAHPSHALCAPAPLSPARADAAPLSPDSASLQEVANALQSCDSQLARVVEVLERLAQDTLSLDHRPLARRSWELLARANRRLQSSALDASRQRLVALRQLTVHFASAIDLLRGARILLQPATVTVAQSTVATHLEVCRENLLEVGAIVGNMSAAAGQLLLPPELSPGS